MMVMFGSSGNNSDTMTTATTTTTTTTAAAAAVVAVGVNTVLILANSIDLIVLSAVFHQCIHFTFLLGYFLYLKKIYMHMISSRFWRILYFILLNFMLMVPV